MLKGAVFDMDGLMFDSEKLTFDCWCKVMQKYDFKASMDIYKKAIGNRRADSIIYYKNVYGQDFDYMKYRSEVGALFNSYIDKNGVPIKKGLFELLDYLKAKKYRLAVATSTSKESAEPMLKKSGVFNYFDYIVYGDNVSNGKPHPEIFENAVGGLGLAPQDCYAFEDSINGIKSAYSAGLNAIMVPDLVEPSEEVILMAKHICKSLDEVIEYIDKT